MSDDSLKWLVLGNIISSDNDRLSECEKQNVISNIEEFRGTDYIHNIDSMRQILSPIKNKNYMYRMLDLFESK